MFVSVLTDIVAASAILNQFTILRRIYKWIKFPHNIQQPSELRDAFYRIHHFPGVVGWMDWTLVVIISPKNDQGYIIVNRKKFQI